jgi:hypothetical protein
MSPLVRERPAHSGAGRRGACVQGAKARGEPAATRAGFVPSTTNRTMRDASCRAWQTSWAEALRPGWRCTCMDTIVTSQ